jgi:Kef-type K+ transport system membrane component KefB
LILNLLSTDASLAEATLPYEALLVLALVLLLGLYAGRLFEKIKLPHITGYIIMGVIIGGILVAFKITDAVESLEIVSSVALGFIAFSIGTELEFKKLKFTSIKFNLPGISIITNRLSFRSDCDGYCTSTNNVIDS